ncbi:MAG: peptide chain release factor N(5)-glutamine methyltransferase [Ignavibacteria bacterium]|nr:peptide chain release factor N(5)-glutamine methyltransferase [Ignavibacteria bacterium]
MDEKKPEKLLDILNLSTEYLKKNNIEDSRLNAELMLCQVLNYDRINLYLNYDRPLHKTEIDEFKILLRRRVKKEPLQYILGKTIFFGYTFIINKNVLIPRPETEFLVEKIISFIDKSELDLYRILEIGTGSGCISVSLSKEIEKLNKNYHILAIDSSKKALELAIENAKLNNVDNEKLTFKYCDLFDEDMSLDSFNIIVSNPPYISYDEYKKLPDEIRLYEPAEALTDFEDGLKFYKKIFELFKKNKNNCTCFLEIGHNQKDSLEKLLYLYGLRIYIMEKDLNNNFRYLTIHI